MGKKRKHKAAEEDAPQFRVGEVVLLRGEPQTVLQVYTGSGNRPMYRLDGRGTIYPETFLRKVEE